MEKFAGFGFDVWTMDFEGYGRSDSTEGNSDIASGVEDLKAATEVVARDTGQERFHFFVESSGALRAGAFMRGEFDGIATEEDLLDSYKKLPYQDRPFVILPGTAHSVCMGNNRQQFWHVMWTFLEMPPRLDGGKVG